MPIDPSKPVLELANRRQGVRYMSGFRDLSYTGRAGQNARRTRNQTKAHFCWLMRHTASTRQRFAGRSNVDGAEWYAVSFTQSLRPVMELAVCIEEKFSNLCQRDVRCGFDQGEDLRSVSLTGEAPD